MKNNVSRGFEGVRTEICLNPLTSDLLLLFEGFGLGLWQSLSPKGHWMCSACFITRCLLYCSTSIDIELLGSFLNFSFKKMFVSPDKPDMLSLIR